MNEAANQDKKPTPREAFGMGLFQTGSFRRALGIALIAKGSMWPFNRLTPIEGTGMGGEKMLEPYRNSAWVMRAIKLIAQPICAVPLIFSTSNKNGTEAAFDDPALKAFWESPGITMSGPMGRDDFIEATVGWLKLKGEAFWILDDSWLVPFPEVKGAGGLSRIIIARPEKIQPVKDGVELKGWTFTDAAGKRHSLLPEQVIQLKYWNPYDELRGLAEWESAQVATEADYLAGIENREKMRAQGDHGLIVTTTDGFPVNDDQRKQITNELRYKKEMSLRGQFRPIFLNGNLKIEDPKIQRADLHWVQARIENRHEIYIALGVPASMADVAASYSIGSASDRFRLIEDSCIPTGAKICSAIAHLASRQMAQPLIAKLFWDDHSTMQAVRAERITAGSELWDRGMPWKEINDHLHLGMQEFPGWEIPYVPFNFVAVDPKNPGKNAPDKNPDYGEVPGDDDTIPQPDKIEAMVRALAAPIQKARDPKSLAEWRLHMAKRRKSVKAYESRFNQILMKARAETLAKIEKHGVVPLVDAPKARAAAAEFMFDLDNYKDGLQVGMKRVTNVALQEAGQQLFEEINRDDPFTMPPERALQFIASRENKLSNVADEVFDEIKSTIEESLVNGDSIKDMAAAVREKFTEISNGRATTVAMTETSAAYGFARHDAMKQAGITQRRWLTSGNANVRAWHEDAEGQVVGMEEPFIVMGEELMYPGDPDGSPENVINCHCIAIPIAGDEDESEANEEPEA